VSNAPSNFGGSVTSAISTQQVARDPAAAQAPVQAAMPPLRLDSFEAVVELFRAKKEGILLTHIMNDVHLVRFEPGRIELRPTEKAPATLTNKMTACLNEWTGTRWFISVSGDLGAPTLKQQAQAVEAEMRRRAAEHPLVKAVLDAFPGATIDTVRDLKTPDARPESTGPESDADEEPAPLPEEDA
jgi:DNA polymerase-3 subunit gamma/tau